MKRRPMPAVLLLCKTNYHSMITLRIFSKGCEYAVRALLCMLAKSEQQKFTAKEVCRKARIPESFTRKVFQSLVKSKYLEAVPGNSGGYRLRKQPDQITLLELIRAVDGKDHFGYCILGSIKCNDKKPCALHSTWLKSKKNLLAQLQDLVNDF